MAYTEPELAVLRKYRLIQPDGSLTQVNLKQARRAGEQPPGLGPLMSEDVINRLLAADTTPDKHWLDWIFFQAGGAQAARDATNEALKRIKERFIDERVSGWTSPKTGEHNPPVPRPEAERRWAVTEPRFREALIVSDEEAVKRLKTFGYFRDWPGNERLYEHVVSAVTKYLKLYSKLLKMNKELKITGQEPSATTPDAIPTHQAMAAIANKVERYFAAQKARGDIRLANDGAPIYEDDHIAVIVPLTYAAAVEHGFDIWPWANREKFEKTLAGEVNTWEKDAWKESTKGGSAIIYFSLKGPVPVWVVRTGGTWQLKDLADLALQLTKETAARNPNTWTVYDQENRNTLTIQQIKNMILAEPARVDPHEEESPIKRGANAYQTPEEAQSVVDSLDRAVRAVQQWMITSFNPAQIKSDVLTLD